MYEQFELSVIYKGEELFFSAQLQQLGYTHRIMVDVYGQQVNYEPDEERNYRAIIVQENPDKQVNPELLKAIAEGIEAILK